MLSLTRHTGQLFTYRSFALVYSPVCKRLFCLEIRWCRQYKQMSAHNHNSQYQWRNGQPEKKHARPCDDGVGKESVQRKTYFYFCAPLCVPCICCCPFARGTRFCSRASSFAGTPNISSQPSAVCSCNASCCALCIAVFPNLVRTKRERLSAPGKIGISLFAGHFFSLLCDATFSLLT